MTAACATSAITDEAELDWEGRPALPDAMDAGAASGSSDSASPDATPEAAVSDEADATEPATSDIDAGLDAGPFSGAPDASAADGGRDSGPSTQADASTRDASTQADASTPADASVDAGPLACPSGTERCGSDCIDTASESGHCGRCDNVCSATQVCTAGSCVAPAPTASNCTTKTYGGHNYLFCTGRSDDWVGARRQCISLNMDLGVPDDQAEQDFFKAHQGGKTLWIGVSDRQTEGEFHAVRFGSVNDDSGAQPSFLPWSSGEPNNTKNCVILGILCTIDEDCAQLRAQDGLWNDSTCSNANAYVCESD